MNYLLHPEQILLNCKLYKTQLRILTGYTLANVNQSINHIFITTVTMDLSTRKQTSTSPVSINTSEASLIKTHCFVLPNLNSDLINHHSSYHALSMLCTIHRHTVPYTTHFLISNTRIARTADGSRFAKP